VRAARAELLEARAARSLAERSAEEASQRGRDAVEHTRAEGAWLLDALRGEVNCPTLPSPSGVRRRRASGAETPSSTHAPREPGCWTRCGAR
jgi:hypothetical protein